jgi:DNA polymerase-3 subunit beta
LQLLTGVVERRQTLPILANVLVTANAEGLSLQTTDLELGMVVRIAIDNGIQPGETTLPARKLMDIARTLPEQALLEVSSDQGRGLIRSGTSRFALLTLPAGDFPRSDGALEGITIRLAQKQLRGLLEATYFSMAQQDVRYYLNGMLLELGQGQLRAVATDGHRLALCDRMTQRDMEMEAGHGSQILLPRKAVLELLRLLEDSDDETEIRISEHHVQFRLSDITFTSKLIDGRFPDYVRVIPAKSSRFLIADRDALRQALVRVAILTSEQSRAVRFRLRPDVLQISTHSPEQEEAEEELPVSYQGDELEIGFNVTYLLDAINAIRDEQVAMHFSDPSSSCLLHPEASEQCKYVIMPMRL